MATGGDSKRAGVLRVTWYTACPTCKLQTLKNKPIQLTLCVIVHSYDSHQKERWDQNSFDPEYPTEPLESFEPAVRKVFKAPRKRVDASTGWPDEQRGQES